MNIGSYAKFIFLGDLASWIFCIPVTTHDLIKHADPVTYYNFMLLLWFLHFFTLPQILWAVLCQWVVLFHSLMKDLKRRW